MQKEVLAGVLHGWFPAKWLFKFFIMSSIKSILLCLTKDGFLKKSLKSGVKVAPSYCKINERQATGSIQLISSLILFVSRSRYIIIQSSFTSFGPKTFRLRDSNTNWKWKYDITVMWIQFLIWRISLLGLLYVSES